MPDQLNGHLDKIGKWTIQTVKRSDTAEGFELLPRRWVVKRTFARLSRCRRLTRDLETTIASATAGGLFTHTPPAHKKNRTPEIEILPFRVRV